MEWKCGSTT
uniref:Uncharacterized protein n=1 Tax=Arundo donax TaxID=35708 RepID=A0A0A9H414_ARUDO